MDACTILPTILNRLHDDDMSARPEGDRTPDFFICPLWQPCHMNCEIYSYCFFQCRYLYSNEKMEAGHSGDQQLPGSKTPSSS